MYAYVSAILVVVLTNHAIMPSCHRGVRIRTMVLPVVRSPTSTSTSTSTSRRYCYPLGISVSVISLLCSVAVGSNGVLFFLQLESGKNERNYPSSVSMSVHELKHELKGTGNPPSPSSESSISSAWWSEDSSESDVSNLMPANDIDSDEYFVVDNACLQANGPRNWTLRVKSKPLTSTTTTTTGVQVITFTELLKVQVREFMTHEFHVVWEKDWNVVDNNMHRTTKLGTHIIISHHETQNNFHLHNNFLLPVYRAFIKTRMDGLLLVEGCVDCWTRRLPMMHHVVLNMLNLTVVHPLEQAAASRETPMCFQRLVIPQPFSQLPFYSHHGRFTKFWPLELFRDYRDRVHDYFLRTTTFSVLVPGTNSNNNGTEKRVTRGTENNNNTSPEKKPVLSFLSRSSNCSSRCITNEQDAVVELSKYFNVHLLDFAAGLTTEVAMSFIMETDVLVGLHGAGLGYTSLLPDRAMVVEFKGRYGEKKAYFLNMASSLNLPYYAVTLRGCPRTIGPAPSDVFTLPSDTVRVLAKQIFNAHLYEKKRFFRQRRGHVSTGECSLPEKIIPCGYLSSRKVARCYLRQESEGSPWRQCIAFNDCNTTGI